MGGLPQPPQGGISKSETLTTAEEKPKKNMNFLKTALTQTKAFTQSTAGKTSLVVIAILAIAGGIGIASLLPKKKTTGFKKKR